MNGSTDRALAWVRAAVGSSARLVSIEALPAASHTNHRVHVETGRGSSIDLLLRRFTDADRLASDPWYSPRDEVAALGALEGAELPVPRLIAEDADGAACGIPALLLTWLPGETLDVPADVEAFVRGLAEPLPIVHAVDTPSSMRTYEPYFVSDGVARADLRPPSWAFDDRVWERAFEVATADPPAVANRFIHRDYHHGNTVWKRGRLTGIVDWTTGCVGPPGIDLAQARINLAWDFGQAAADAFLDAWRALDPGLEADPYWDVLDAVDWLSDPAPGVTTEKLRRYETFVARALAEIR